MKPIRVFVGYDEREAIGFSVFCHSLLARASRPVSIIPLAAMGLPVGSNAFTLSRFLVPYLCEWHGSAIFLDGSDMLCDGDIAELDALFSPAFAVQCVKHPDYTTRHPMKYRGTPMQCDNRNYPRKNWMSAAIFNCEHPAWAGLTPDNLERRGALASLQLANVPDAAIGELPAKWNCLIDEGQESEGAKVLHWTAGIPAFPMYRSAPGARDWWAEHDRMNAAKAA